MNQSSAIRSAEFNNGTLTVEFQSDSRYEYTGVPQAVYEGLQNASSVGQYFVANIRDRYPARRLS